jgi:hypothetical protein
MMKKALSPPYASTASEPDIISAFFPKGFPVLPSDAVIIVN